MKSTSLPVLRIADFRLIVATRFLAYFALQCQAVIVGWQVYQIKPDPLLLGLIGLAEAIPAITSSFVSGHVVDNNRPLAIYRLSTFALFINTCILWIAASPFVHLGADARLVMLFAGVFISGAARSFASPAVFTMIPRVVPRPLISSAAAWNSSAYQFASIGGPALGGLIYAYGGVVTAFSVPPAFLLISCFLQTRFSSSTAKMKSESTREPYLKSISTAIAFAVKEKVLLSTMTLDMFSVLFGGAVAILPMFADQVLASGSTGWGLLRAAPAIGSVAVAVILAVRPLEVISGRTLLIVIAGFGLTTIGFALSTTFWLAFGFLLASGAFDGVSMVMRSTILQLLTPDHMRGRISALNSVFITSSNEIGAFESGLAARLLGLVPSLIFGGAMTVAIVAATAGLVPELRKTRIRNGDVAKS
jgi:MFS family permease